MGTANGMLLTGGGGAGGDGLEAVAGGGVPIRGDITGNLVGTVSTLTTYTGNTVQTGDNFALTNSGTFGLAAIKTLEDTIAGYLDTEIAAIKAKTDSLTFTLANQVDANALTIATAMRPGIRKNTALTNFEILMTDSTNHNPATGLTVTVTRSIDGGAFAALAVTTVTEISNGWYKFDFAASDLNGTVIGVRATAAASDDLDFTIKTSP